MKKYQLIPYGTLVCCWITFRSIAVPLGASALDEASVRTKARMSPSSYLFSKPDKYAVWFYMVVGCKSTYISSVVDNWSGNETEESGPEQFCWLHRQIRTPYNKILVPSTLIKNNSATALWILQMTH